jgi:hypothetical protein
LGAKQLKTGRFLTSGGPLAGVPSEGLSRIGEGGGGSRDTPVTQMW